MVSFVLMDVMVLLLLLVCREMEYIQNGAQPYCAPPLAHQTTSLHQGC
jgi:hypothetical protein